MYRFKLKSVNNNSIFSIKKLNSTENFEDYQAILERKKNDAFSNERSQIWRFARYFNQ